MAYWTGGQGEFYVGGGAAGMTRLPDWVANLRAHPAATVIVGRRRIAVIADELAGSEYEHARSHAVAIWPGVLRYERMSGRRVPYFRLSPNPKP